MITSGVTIELPIVISKIIVLSRHASLDMASDYIRFAALSLFLKGQSIVSSDTASIARLASSDKFSTVYLCTASYSAHAEDSSVPSFDAMNRKLLRRQSTYLLTKSRQTIVYRLQESVDGQLPAGTEPSQQRPETVMPDGLLN